ncbi:conserved hypothetical protein [Thermoplasma acidophilum]|uniref:Segregation and condensation protein A n=1 Tax=Thermoplasma acidophilum (strain ATCC 25905 / DSM 1728 / JCM 9062 / NBRC 15155 / AMRC-C165) TaxID=273075 RepID=Q9HK22_THEAC|nr:conserved hypothetical protein [Thermoplasma acidophilum]
MQASDEDQAEYYRDLERSIKSKKVVDPSKAAIIKILEMCADGLIDPWNVDLTKFSQIMIRFTEGGSIDFQFAGRALAEAWSVLRRKSDWTAKDEAPEENEIPEEYGDEMPEEVQPVDVTPVITVPFRRPVSLIEVIDQVRHNIARRQPVRQRALPVSFSIERLNSESPEEQLERVIGIIEGYPSDTMRMSDVWGKSRRDQASFFLYSLFLYHDGRIEMMQETPDSDIIIRKIH